MNITQHLRNEVLKTTAHTPLSGVTSYHLLSGSLSLQNSVVTNGMATTLYTGNGTTQSVVTDVDMATQWGNLATEKFGGLVWGKSRSGIASHYFTDTVRGATINVSSDTTAAQVTNATGLTSFSSTGFSIGALAGLNTNLATYSSWNFQTTHRITGTTNHGKAYTCHYNPFTGFTMVQYEGSGLAGHEIPHHLGRKLSISAIKNLTTIVDWDGDFLGNRLELNLTNASVASIIIQTDVATTINAIGSGNNASTNQYIMYGWANSYFDEANTLIGNYYTYVDANNILRMDVHTGLSRENVLWQMSKTILTTGDWDIVDFTRGNTKELNANLSAIESTITANALVKVASPAVYPRATDTSNLNLNAIIPYANGIDASGTKVTALTKNETVSGLTYTQGKNYIWYDNTGAYGVLPYRPRYLDSDLITERAGDNPNYYDVKSNTWYNTVANPELVTNGTFDSNITGWTNALGVGTVDWVSGTLRTTIGTATTFGAKQVISLIEGTKYTIKFNVSIVSGDMEAYVQIKDVSNLGLLNIALGVTSGTYSYTFVAPTNSHSLYIGADAGSTADIRWDNISVFKSDLTLSTPITNSRNYLDAIVYADAGGQPTYVEQLPKTEYKDAMVVDKLNVLSGFDLNQKWYDVTASRVVGATYTNTTGKPKIITIYGTGSSTASGYAVLVDGLLQYGSTPAAAAAYCGIAGVIVPAGKTYKVIAMSGTVTIIAWNELY